MQLWDGNADDEDMESCVTDLINVSKTSLAKILRSPGERQCGAKVLATLDIPIFDGKDISSYKPFIEMFEAMAHKDNCLSSVQKLCFPKKSH